MIKQTIIWTALPHRTGGAPAEGTKLRLSLFAAPRLWNDDPSVATMKLSSFPDFLDWPDKVKQATFTISFDGGSPLSATADFSVLRSDLWKALFDTDTDVIPFAFEDLSGVPTESFPAGTIHDAIQGIYTKAITDPSYGGGEDLPDRGKLAEDPDLVEIARPVRPEPPYHDPDADRRPVNIDQPGTGGEGPPGGGEGPPGCRPGCLSILLWPFRLLRWLLRRLGIISLLPLITGAKPAPKRKTPIRRVSGGAPGTVKEAFDDLKSFVKPTNTDDPPLPDASAIKDIYDFHRMVSSLGDYPLLLRSLGLVVDVTVTLPSAVPPATGTVKATVSLPLITTTVHYCPRTHYQLDAQRFVAQARPSSPEIADGLLRLDDANRFRVLQLDVAGGGLKLQNTATNIVGLQSIDEWPANSPEDSGLPSLQTAGISVVRVDSVAELKNAFLMSYCLNSALAAQDGSLVKPFGGEGSPAPTDELFAEDVTRGYRFDVFDDQSKAWHSLCRRIGTYRFLDAPGGALTEANQRDEGFVQLAATEPVPGSKTQVLKVHDSIFTWDGWSLAAPRPGLAILPDQNFGNPPNTAVTEFGLETEFLAEPKSLPRLRFAYKYRLRARIVDLAGNSAIDPGDPEFAATPPQTSPEFEFQRFEPVAPPPLMLRAKPLEGESLEHIVVRSTIDDPPAAIALLSSERHIVPPKTSQLMAERHRKFDGSPSMNKDQAAYDLASTEAGSMTHKLSLTTGKLELIDGAVQDGDHWIQTKEQFELSYLPDPHARGVLLLGLPGMASFGEVIEPAGGPVNKLPFDGTWPNLKAVRIRLEGLSAGAALVKPSWNATDRILTVKLPQGERATVRVSCYMQDADLDKMALWDWVKVASPPTLSDLKAKAVSGRIWPVLPYRTITLVHAVQQPLRIPALSSLSDPAPKVLADTTARVTGQVDVDAKSTGKLEIRASWEDPIDDLSKPAFENAVKAQNEMQVDEVLLPDPSDDTVDIDLVHALGDTNYHRITYTPIATTRFREYFPQTPAPDPQTMVRPAPTESPASTTIDIPNSARPAAPRPLYALPTWKWVESTTGLTTTRQREGNSLRIYMDRPWFSSGAGELLGVVIRPEKQPFVGAEAETIRKYTSEWAQDPIREATPTNLLRLEDLVDPVNAMNNLIPDEMPSPVHVAGYRPHYDTDRNLWFCDLSLHSERNYFPFVRLAVARFQPISVPGAHLSRIVLLDWAQIAPNRTVEYDRSQLAATSTIRLRVSGPAYRDPQVEGFGTSLMFARLEQRDLTHQKDELGWTVASSVKLSTTVESTDETVWEGELVIPASPAGPRRVSVLEFETFGEPGEKAISVGAGIEGSTFVEPQVRVVFADALEVS